ncbi:max-interacting protein 1-like [Mizuhopecten yessoensis]|uniref:Max-interacting protein 1 n=1 Tax=Mizuhopecten yessoensis TaxID=6573 RepID=A0A210QL69_MIZYE|nr:max-interacting protein 1-like [Mizuhopecten yessoensis]OWF49474.1 Max-interacting protein 1 [Mizuhopecten yessoensis]
MAFNISQLIQAAEFLDRREREAEHGYASTAPMPEYLNKKKSKPKKSQGNRSTHNELEKNRRAQLRYCLEKLKDVVPVGSDSSRHTTLGLLTKTKGFIRNLEDGEKKKLHAKEQLKREKRFLQRRLEGLLEGQYRVRQERSISECSTSTNSTTSSTSESDEIDILGYGSGQSDTDDHSSIESSSSDYYTNSKHIGYNPSPLESL